MALACWITFLPFNFSFIFSEILPPRCPHRWCFLWSCVPTSSVIYINCCQSAQSAAQWRGVLLSIKTTVLSQHLVPDGMRPSIAALSHTSASTHTWSKTIGRTKETGVAFVGAGDEMFARCSFITGYLLLTLMVHGLIWSNLCIRFLASISSHSVCIRPLFWI